MAKQRIPEATQVSEDQLLEVLRHLDAEPIKVTLRREDGSRSYWMDRAIKSEARRTALRKADARYRNEILPDEERMVLQDRIRRLRRQLGV